MPLGLFFTLSAKLYPKSVNSQVDEREQKVFGFDKQFKKNLNFTLFRFSSFFDA